MYSKETLLELLKKKVLVRQENEPIFNAKGGSSSWIFDFRRVFLKTDVLQSLAVIFWEEMESKYPFQVGGMESASIPLITAIILEGRNRGKPANGFYIRKSRKKQGLLRQIEGELTQEPVILVDDLINNGNTFKKQIVLLEELGYRVTDIFAIVRFRELTHYRFLEEHGVTIHTLFTLKDFGVSLRPPLSIQYDQFEVLWRLDGRAPDLHRVAHKSRPVCDDTFVYFPTDDGYVYALVQETGEKKWHFKIGLTKRPAHRISDLTLAANTIYFSTQGGKVVALDSATGKTLWIFADADRIDAVPAVSSLQQKVYAVVNRGWFLKKNFLIALDIRTGSEVWSIPLPDYSRIQPAITEGEDLIFIGCENGTILCLDTSNGHTEWTQELKGSVTGITINSKPANTSSIYVTTTEGFVYKLVTQTGAVKKTTALEGQIHTAPLVTPKGLLVTNLDKFAYNLDLETLETIWLYETSGRIFADPAYINEHVYVGSNDARLYEIDPQTGKATGITQVTERITTPLLFCSSTNSYFLTTYANELYCLSRAGSRGLSRKEKPA